MKKVWKGAPPPSTTMSSPAVDLVLIFRADSAAVSKQEKVEEAKQAQQEYTRLIKTLQTAGFKATGRRGVSNGQLLVLIYAPWAKIEELVQNERHSDFLLGLPTSTIPSSTRDFTAQPLSSAERLRLVHSFISATTVEGGLGIVPGAHDWPRLESIMSLHDQEFNDVWMRAWTRRRLGFGVSYPEILQIKDQFGEAVAFYFAFLSAYTKSLLLPSIVGALFFMTGRFFHPLYSAIIVVWSVVFVEWWRVKERILSIRWGCYGSFRVEKRRPQFRGDSSTANDNEHSFPWWKREMRTAMSFPVIVLYGAILVLLLTAIFLFEAFVTQLYTGPGARYASFSPTVLFIALVPRLLGLYHSSAVAMTNWENHSRQSSYDYSLTIKTFALSGLVAYSGLTLSAFVYLPFHEQMMTIVYNTITSTPRVFEKANQTGSDLFQAKARFNSHRLQDQMFAFMVTNQVISFVIEVILPFVLRKADSVRNPGMNGKKKRVGFEDGKSDAKEEREFLENVRHQVALPDYTLFGDYAEMVTQFGYVAAWSTIWPLAPLAALFNNWFELRGDAFKIIRHCRRPLPQRAETIGPWLEALGFITWLAALTNSALVYMFEPRPTSPGLTINSSKAGTTLHSGLPPRPSGVANVTSEGAMMEAVSYGYQQLLIPSLLIALSSSHAYILVRVLIRHIIVRLAWKGSPEERQAVGADRQVKAIYLRSLRLGDSATNLTSAVSSGDNAEVSFWARDDGNEELYSSIKEA